jgi:membrane protein YdbS with pleckstrin-like domain
MDHELAWLSPSPRMWRARLSLIAVVSLVLLIAAGVIVTVTAGARYDLIVVAVVIVVGGIAAWLARRRYRAWAYVERADDLLVRRGVMIKRLTVVPYGRMQFIDVTSGPIDRMFGLATVQLHTAAARTDARIPGLDRPAADRLRDQLASLGEAKAAGL